MLELADDLVVILNLPLFIVLVNLAVHILRGIRILMRESWVHFIINFCVLLDLLQEELLIRRCQQRKGVYRCKFFELCDFTKQA